MHLTFIRSAGPGPAVFTTGVAAKICGVAPRTVAIWFDRGRLKGYRIPGSADRRVPLAALVEFVRANGMEGVVRGPLNAALAAAGHPPYDRRPDLRLCFGLDEASVARVGGEAVGEFDLAVRLGDASVVVVGPGCGTAAADRICERVRVLNPTAVLVRVVGDDVDPATATAGRPDAVARESDDWWSFGRVA